ncbi:hypothetical protein KDW_20470 [Dictyobacter vulcani]|uniref:Haloacid dehalogenase n=1 Tax=Dictyobacter vulcani TaxID=2607529 RepID=A0A5J4KJA1_9CHLR|nr:hypothetical protein [Dictyobacter vulcani]GER87885.1 hypothetical protein KDW_20470 [Dictyobacter vulcani]
MFCAIDIDGTIAMGGIPGDLRANMNYFKELGIPLPDDITDFPTLLHHPYVIPLHSALPGAIWGVAHVATMGSVGYFTVRKHADSQQQSLIYEATQQWLRQKAFPNPMQVVLCNSVLHKLIKLYEQEKDNQEPFVLIDDKWSQVVQHFDAVFSEDHRQMGQAIKERLTLLAYGVSVVPAVTNGLRLVPLPSWDHIVDIHFCS